MRSASADRSKSCESTSRSCLSSDLTPWKSICGSKLNHSKSTLTMSKSYVLVREKFGVDGRRCMLTSSSELSSSILVTVGS